ncbi:MAG: PEP-utilizing enzyme [Gammaproteobacteria bacterium]|nr:PEP-utilizing enzyme [Gammaproteobacteria bacterium]
MAALPWSPKPAGWHPTAPIVAREMGIPAVVGLSAARAHLITGMSVTVDGANGEVAILDKPRG